MLNGLVPFPAGRKFQYIVLNAQPDRQPGRWQRTFTEELQFIGEAADGKLKWQAGAYLEIAKPMGFNQGHTGILLDCARPGDNRLARQVFGTSGSDIRAPLDQNSCSTIMACIAQGNLQVQRPVQPDGRACAIPGTRAHAFSDSMRIRPRNGGRSP